MMDSAVIWQGWTDTCVDQLRALWAEGCSASEIAKVIGAVSRNAVISKLDQLGLIGNRQGSGVPNRLYKAQTKPRPMADARDLADPVPLMIDGQPITFLNCGKNDCRWPYGDAASIDFHICGHPVANDLSPYCEYHRRKAFARKHVEIPEAA
jgi:GcrA cell cycle regulator